MLSKKKPSLFNNCVDDVFNFFFDSENNKLYLSEDISPEFIFLMDNLMNEEYGVVYLKSIEKCPVCGSKISKNGTCGFLLNKSREIKKQKYVCKNKKCRKHTKTCLKKFIDKYCNYTRDIREFGLNTGCIAYCSYDKKSELIELVAGVNLSRSTVHYHEKTLADEYLARKEKEMNAMIKKLEIEPEGIYHYDEQILWVDTNIQLRMTLLDANNNLIINEKIVDNKDFNKNTIKKFLNKSLKGLKLKAIVTDGYQAYPSIVEALGAIHQKCVFHKMQTLMKKVIQTLNKLKRKIKSHKEQIEKNELKIMEWKEKNHEKRGRINKTDKKRQKFSNKIKKLNKENRELRANIRQHKTKTKELKKYTDKISLIFKSKTQKTAKKRFQKLKDKIKELPEEIASFIEKLSKDIDNTLNHITNNDIPNTNNKLEGYYKITLPRYLKRTFRTNKGLNIKLRLNRIRWTKRNVLKIK
jgi:DNA repair exonuclease SbcCD ATPase subunit